MSIGRLYPRARLSILTMDHTSLSTVVSAAKSFLSIETALHGLINNAGIMCTPFELTKDGYEAQWQTNYLAHWLLTYLLLPLMLKTSKSSASGSVRIVNVASSGHYSAPTGGINFADTSLPAANGMTRYGQSKLANVLHAKLLNNVYGPESSSAQAGQGEIWIAAVHPGLVKSELGTRAELPLILRLVIAPYKALGGQLDADTGSWTSVFCAASPEMMGKNSGAYFQRIADPHGWQSKMAKDVVLAETLEKWTQEQMRNGGWLDLLVDDVPTGGTRAT